jgi:hypothetical protein
MVCTPLPGGGFLCARAQRRPICSIPSCGRPAEFECDFKIPRKKSGTCDARLCDAHRSSVGEDRDLCPAHKKWEEARHG